MNGCLIHPEVASEIADAVGWYQAIDPELGQRIHAEVFQSIELARDTPHHYPKIYKDFRRVLCRNFPYKVIFEIQPSGEHVHIVAVMHQSQYPEYWKERVQG